MVQISKKKLPKDVLAKLFLLFFEVVGKKYLRNEFQEVIDDLFSETEQIMIIKRIAIIYLLLKDVDNATISEVLSVSPATICRFASLTRKNEGIVKYLNKVLKHEKIADFFNEVFYELFARPGKYGINWSNAWKTKFEHERKKQTGL